MLTCHPFISIVVPIYNVSDYIEDCLQSIANQDYDGNVECVLVDDCGTDNSIDLAHRFIDNYSGSISFSIISHSYNRGLSAARNTGLRKASGDYILFVDSDDYLTHDALTILSKPLETERYDMIVSRFKKVGLGCELGPIIHGGAALYGDDIRKCYIKDSWDNTATHKLCRKDFLLSKSLFFYEGVLFEDFLWGMEVYLEARSLLVVDAITYYYRIREDSITTAKNTRENKRNKLKSSVIVLSQMQKAFLSHGLQNDVDMHEYMERSRAGMYYNARYNWSLFKEAYFAQRVMMPIEWQLCFHMNGWFFSRQIRDLHLLFPPTVGAVYYFMWWHFRRFVMKLKSFIKKRIQ